MREDGANRLLDVAFAHPIKLFVNALGPPPASVVERCRAKGIAIGALTGTKEHALKNIAAGVEILVVSGTEAGGHCGEISTMVVVPEVLDAIKDHAGVEVLAAGGIATGPTDGGRDGDGCGGGLDWLRLADDDRGRRPLRRSRRRCSPLPRATPFARAAARASRRVN